MVHSLTHMKKYLLGTALAVTLVIGGLFSKQALASAWEWIQIFDTIGDCYDVCPNNTVLTLKRNVQTSGNYYEYRGVWAAVVPGIATTTEPLANYQRLDQCNADGYVNTSEWDVCDYTTATTSTNATSTLWLRATTNFSGCSPYQDYNPSSTCGDIITRTIIITP